MRKFPAFIVVAFFASALAACATSSSVAGRGGDLVGVWKVELFCDKDESTGAFSERFGHDPIGYFVYTPTGHAQGHGEYIGYFGTYTVDAAHSTVVHHVEGGTLPDYIASDQVRKYRLTGDTLSIGLEPLPCRVLRKVG